MRNVWGNWNVDVECVNNAKENRKMIGGQCEGCVCYKDGKCTRVSNDGETVGVCWMEEEY